MGIGMDEIMNKSKFWRRVFREHEKVKNLSAVGVRMDHSSRTCG